MADDDCPDVWPDDMPDPGPEPAAPIIADPQAVVALVGELGDNLGSVSPDAEDFLVDQAWAKALIAAVHGPEPVRWITRDQWLAGRPGTVRGASAHAVWLDEAAAYDPTQVDDRTQQLLDNLDRSVAEARAARDRKLVIDAREASDHGTDDLGTPLSELGDALDAAKAAYDTDGTLADQTAIACRWCGHPSHLPAHCTAQADDGSCLCGQQGEA